MRSNKQWTEQTCPRGRKRGKICEHGYYACWIQFSMSTYALHYRIWEWWLGSRSRQAGQWRADICKPIHLSNCTHKCRPSTPKGVSLPAIQVFYSDSCNTSTKTLWSSKDRKMSLWTLPDSVPWNRKDSVHWMRFRQHPRKVFHSWRTSVGKPERKFPSK